MTDALKKKPYNNFVLLRLIVALWVLISHYKVVGGATLLDTISFSPEFRVAGFFVVSGYVIIASFEKLPVVKSFYAKRFFRLYPLYGLVILLQTIFMSLFFMDNITEQIPSITKYFFVNMIMLNFLQYDIGGLLANAKNPGINPSLWTLKIEVMFYAIVPLLSWFFHKFRWQGLIVLFVASSIFNQYLIETGHPQLAKQLPGALRYIVVGMALYYYRNNYTLSVSLAWLFILSAFIVLTFHNQNVPQFLYPIFIGLIVIFFATKVPCPRPKVDLSYGVYLVHAPLIQFSILLGVFQDNIWFLTALISVSMIIAYFGYRYIELPCVALGRKISKYAAMTPTLPNPQINTAQQAPTNN